MPLRPVGERRGVPSEQPVLSQGLAVILRGIEHHFDHVFHIAFGGSERSDIDPHAAGDGGAHLIFIQHLTFDLAGLNDFLCQRLKRGLPCSKVIE